MVIVIAYKAIQAALRPFSAHLLNTITPAVMDLSGLPSATFYQDLKVHVKSLEKAWGLS
jgi:hypothetical protein